MNNIMRSKIGKLDPINEKDAIFHELLEECRKLNPGARLSLYLTHRLEKFCLEDRAEIANRVKVGCAPLFVACKRGQVEVVEYLITVCNANIEQKGLYEVAEDRSTHIVTPIWCAAVSGQLNVVELLLKHNANINAVSDTGSTPVRSACYMTHLNIVKLLVAKGADINKANYNGGTCLINSVQSATLCDFLLQSGADVNARDIQNKTALHYAIQEHRLETTELLLKYGADYNAKSRYGDDALQMACLKGALYIFEFLTQKITYTPEKLANAHELLGATYLDDRNNFGSATLHWKEALSIREKNGIMIKNPILPPKECYRFQKEFETLQELENISLDTDQMRIQSLLIAERILGHRHKDTIFRLMYRGASYADMMRYQRCIDLWRRALEIRVQKDTILYTDTCFTAQALVRLMVDYNEKIQPAKSEKRFRDAYGTYCLLTQNILAVRELLLVKPVYKRQADFFDKILKCISHLIYLMLETGTTVEEKQLIHESVAQLVKLNPKSVITEDSLLHLAVSNLNTIRSSYFVDEEPIVVFPNYNVIKLLLDCGALVNAKNESKSTPLHIATGPLNYMHWVIKLLLQYGAHIDQPNLIGACPVNAILLNNKRESEVNEIYVLNYKNLKCLCATSLIKHQINYKNQIPKTLELFVELHEA